MRIKDNTARSVAAAAFMVLAALGVSRTATAAPPDQSPRLAYTEATPMPSDAQMVALADNSMRLFMTSVRERSMQTFWNHLSLQFQRSYSPVDLDGAFKSFYEMSITGDPLVGRSPIFKSRPSFNAQGHLVIEGYYKTTPQRLSFTFGYILEGSSWKLISINATSALPPDAPIPVAPRKLLPNEA